MSETSQTFPQLPTLIRRLRLASDIKNQKRIQFTRLARKYEVSRRTIYTDVKWILGNVNLELLQKAALDKVLWALGEAEKDGRWDLTLKYCMPFLARGLTQRIESYEQVETEETVTLNVTESEDEILSKAATILARKDRFKNLH